MTKTVFKDAYEVAHIWAQRNHTEGRIPSGNIYFYNNTIYSYGNHFPIATFVTRNGSTKVLFNDTTYSHTTNKHQIAVRSAIKHYDIISCDTSIIKAVLNFQREIKLLRKELIRLINLDFTSVISIQARSAIKRRKEELKLDDIARAESVYNEYVKVLEFFGAKMPKKNTKLLEQLKTDANLVHNAYVKLLKKQQRKKEAERKKAQQEILVKALQTLPLWRERDYKGLEYKEQEYIASCDKTFLRIDKENDTIVTSQRAAFPVSHAIKAFPYILTCRTNSTEWQNIGHSIHLGHYTIDKIDKEGNVKAGCHFVTWDQIEYIARELKLI